VSHLTVNVVDRDAPVRHDEAMTIPSGHLFAVTDSTLVEFSGDGARLVASGSRGMLAFALLASVQGPGVSLDAVDALKPSMADGYTVVDFDLVEHLGTAGR
jgi:hypothetical protein